MKIKKIFYKLNQCLIKGALFLSYILGIGVARLFVLSRPLTWKLLPPPSQKLEDYLGQS